MSEQISAAKLDCRHAYTTLAKKIKKHVCTTDALILMIVYLKEALIFFWKIAIICFVVTVA